MTRAGFLAAYEVEMKRNKVELWHMWLNLARLALDNHEKEWRVAVSETASAAWITIGGEGPVTLDNLRALPEK